MLLPLGSVGDVSVEHGEGAVGLWKELAREMEVHLLSRLRTQAGCCRGHA